MKERFTKLAPLAVPLVLFAAACKSDGSEKTPPKFEDGISVGVPINQDTPTSQQVEPTIATQTPKTPAGEPATPQKSKAQRDIGPARETESGCMQTVVEKTNGTIYTYDIFCAPFPIDPMLRELPQKFLQARLPQSDFDRVHTLLLDIQAGSQNSAAEVVEVQEILNVNCQRDTNDQAIDAIARGNMSYAFHNQPEAFEQNPDVFFGSCYMGDMYSVDDAEQVSNSGQGTESSTYTKSLGGDSIVLNSNVSYEKFLSEQNLGALERIYEPNDFLNLKLYIGSAKNLDSQNPSDKNIRQFLKQTAQLLETKCQDNEVVKDNLKKLLSLIDQKYPDSFQDFASFAQVCNITNNPA